MLAAVLCWPLFFCFCFCSWAVDSFVGSGKARYRETLDIYQSLLIELKMKYLEIEVSSNAK